MMIAEGAEYFVNKQGNDANNGTSRETAFLTIQKGMDALKPGGTLTIGPGEYFESAKRADLGSDERKTVIRAEIPGTVLLRGDEPAPEFRKVEGYRFVYAAQFDRAPEAVLEHGTMKILEKKPNVTEVEFEPGACFYDAEAKMLYISSADQQPPGRRRYTVAVSGNSGLYLERPQRVVIEGLSATGFYRAMARRPGFWVADYQWGIVLDEPTACTVRKCCAFLNCGGIALNNGRGNAVEDCVCHDNIAGNIQYYGGPNHADNVVRNCYAYRGECGIDSYTHLAGPMLMQNNIAWGHDLDYSNKGGGGYSSKFGFVEGCVALSNLRIRNLMNCVVGGRDNEYGRGVTYLRDNIIFVEEKNLDIGREFADPINMDFRLQGDSRFRGKTEDGRDRGLYPDHDYTIYFLSPNGNDENDGTSLRTPWKSLGRALKELAPGGTLYLAEGVYTASGPVTLGRAGAGKIHIRGRGRDRVVIESRLNVVGSAGVEFERLNFSAGADLKDSEGIRLVNCAFSARGNGLTAANVKDIKVTHAFFARAPLRLKGASGVYLSGNIYANAGGPAVILEGENDVLYSDYNSYQDAARCWQAKGEGSSLSELRKRHDRYSEVLKPEIAADGGSPQLMNADVFAGRGPQGTSLGRYQEYEESVPRLAGPFLHSVSDTTANIEWRTSTRATCELAWGETPDMAHTVRSRNTYRFTSFSLTGLKPGQKYYFKIRSVEPSNEGAAMPLPNLTPDAEPLTFTTAATGSKPAVYYVAPDGDDGNTGLSRDKAWRTVSNAASQVNAGDTVLIAGGTYNEVVRVRASGAPGKPITFRSIPGKKVVFDGDHRSLSQAFVANEKKHVYFDGFYFTNFSGPVIVLLNSEDVRVTRCFSDGRGPGYAGGLLFARHCTDVLAKNCVSINGFGCGMSFIDSPGTLIEHNVFFRNLIGGCTLLNEPDQKVVMRKNIFTDSLPFKSKVPYFEIAKIESLVEGDNCYYMRLPDEQRKMFQCYGNDAYEPTAQEYGMKTEFDKPPIFADLVRISLRMFKEIKGETGSFFGNPWFEGTLGMKEGEITRDRGEDYLLLLSDKLHGKADLDFPDLFATAPEVVRKGIGLVPADFEDFGFDKR